MVVFCAGRVFDASYVTECPECGEDIEPGDEARMVAGVAVHVGCHECSCGHCGDD